MQSSNPAIAAHIERLVRALAESKETEQSAQLQKLLKAQTRAGELTPNRVVLSRGSLVGETLTPSVPPPVDKETGAALAEILRPGSETPQPIFGKELGTAVGSLLEEWAHADDLRAANLRPALSTMIFGEPGTGKTMLAHFISSQLNLPIVVAKLDGLISSFLGTTARNIAALFNFANRYQCVLLLDEFDAIAKLRDDPQELGEIKRVVNTLLQCIDARAVTGFTIAITNHDSLLDPAVWRRFDIRIEVKKPDFFARRSILEKRLASVLNDDTKISFLAWVMENSSGSDLEKISEFIQRQIAIRKHDFELFDSLSSYAQLSAHQETGPRKSLLTESTETIITELIADKSHPFNQEQLASIFGKTQSTISRMIKRERRKEETSHE